MSEIMRPIPFPFLVRWVQGEYKNHGSVFGIRGEKFYRTSGLGKQTAGFPPIGPAAGPHSQLAQNILAAFLAGARFTELKTVQTMDGDELRKAVPRPCINAADEGYNVEWSTELTVGGAFEEYVKAWFLCHVFAKEFGLDSSGAPVFNMSVGYNLDGIQSKKIDDFIEGMKDARNTDVWQNCYKYISDNISLFERFTKADLAGIPAVISPGITLSTLHGCPREEIEKIAVYLLCEKGLQTNIKCNPTLLGYERARKLLDDMGYGYVSFDEHHFKNDLQFDDAVAMLGRLTEQARARNLIFGVKLTNTFPVKINRNELPGNEMYMSGRPLFALSINVANKLSHAFNGKLPISYSGGADYFNLADILAVGIRPVTLATAILKPGGYERFTQLAELAEKALADNAADADNPAAIDVPALDNLAASLPKLRRYHKEYRQFKENLTNHGRRLSASRSPLPVFNCFKAPCADSGCPIHQRIPEYLAAVADENYSEAFKIIAVDNTAPSITGTICDHQCQSKCTRIDYEDPLQIRAAKLSAAANAQKDFISALCAPEIKTAKSAGIIGAGPAGIAAAVFLRRNGVRVTVYEKREGPFGMVRYVIPSFRISDDAIFMDFQIAQKLGVEFVFNNALKSVSELRIKHDFLVIAVGAWEKNPPALRQDDGKMLDAINFLEESKKSQRALELGKKVAVIGGGDVAMDCARAAMRNRGVESVSVVYRRTREFMPSQYEEQEAALADGVEFMELLAPESFTGGVLACEKMRLGRYDDSGRRGVEKTGEKAEFCFDTVISATGQQIDACFFADNGITLDKKGFPLVNESCESSLPNVYITGDCKNGPATVVKAIADSKAAAADILKKLGLETDFTTENSGGGIGHQSDFNALILKKGVIAEIKRNSADARRCLSCGQVCAICADVCPNRANVLINMKPDNCQIVHIDCLCNECGNCAVFCPCAGLPYREKFTIFSTEQDFIDSENPGILKTSGDSYKIRLEDKSLADYRSGDLNIPRIWISMIETISKEYGYLLTGCCP